MAGYRHGAYVHEVSSTIAVPQKIETGLHVVFGTAPIHQTANPTQKVHKLILVTTYEEAVEQLGYSEDYGKYTLCQVMDAYFKHFAVGPIVLCNVLDSTKHKKENAEKEYQVVEKQIMLTEADVLPSSLVVKKTDDTVLASGTDYITSFQEDGSLMITLLGTAATEAVLKVTSTSLNPEAVTEADVIGGVDVDSGKETGMELIRRVYPTYGRFPGYIMAPGWSHRKNVAAVMAAKCKDINGLFRCECLIDLDTGAAPKYTDCEKVKEDNGFLGETMIILWPMARLGGKIYHYSAIYGAMTAWVDAQNDSVPSVSPSNIPLNIDAAVLADGTVVDLDHPEANTLNGAGIVTILNNGGLRSWGNNTAAYPQVTETKDRWINCRRAFSWWGNSFIVACRDRIDQPANRVLIESLIDSENIRGNSYVQQGKFAGARMGFHEEDNTTEDLLEGHITVRQYLAPFTPAEHIENILSFDHTLLENALGGAE